MIKSCFTLVFALCFFSFLMAQKNGTDKIDPTIFDKYTRQTEVEYIVLMKDRIVFNGTLPLKTKIEKATFVYQTLVTKATATQEPVLAILKQRKVPYQSFYVINAIKIKSDYDLMQMLARRADVDKIIDNAPFRMLDYQEEKSVSSLRNGEPEWGLKMIKADSVWLLGYRGEGAIIAGQDTGYDWDLSPLKTKYMGYREGAEADHNYHWHDAISENNPAFPDSLLNPCGYSIKSPCDDNNHGTHTMGTMIGEDDTNSIGVAPDAKWIACRNMDRGWGQPSTYMECFEWFLAPYDLDRKFADPAKAPHVINNSWYCSEEEGCNPSNFILMEEIVKNLKASGVVVVVSAGNSGGQGCGSVTGPPAFFESSFSVGATNREDNIAGFSSRGPVVIDGSLRLKPNVSAPGVGVRSVIRGGTFAAFNGTSMAGPHVAGLVGLLISANPALAGRVEVIEDIIEATAVPRTSTQDCGNFLGMDIPNAVFGYGRVDALAAVRKAIAFTSDVDDTRLPELKVFPNPVQDMVTFVASNGKQEILNVVIYDLSGKVVLHQKFNNPHLLVTVPVDFLPPGMYVYSVASSGKQAKGKFVKS